MATRDYWRRMSGISRTRRQVLFAGAAAAGVGASAVVGCSSRKPSAAGGPAASGSGGAANLRPQPGGIFSQRLFTDPAAFDVHQAVSYTVVWPAAPAYNQLVQFDPQDPDKKIIPDLADSFDVSLDGMTIVFRLHAGVKFHDDSDFSSEDVKVNVDWIKNPPQAKPSPRKAALAVIDRVETPDPLTARFVLKQPSPSLLPNLATEYMVMGAKSDLAKGDLGMQFNGTGPFTLKNFRRGVSLELERNPGYWVKDRPYLDGVKFAIVADDNTAFTDFLAGQFQRFFPVGPENIDRVAKETNGKATVVKAPSTNPQLLFFNGTKKPFNDIRVRQAVSLALDRQAAIQLIVQGKGVPGGYLMPGGQWALSAGQRKQVPGYDKPDVAEAKKLLAAAGVTEPLSGRLLTRTDAIFRDMATFVQGSLQKAFGWNYQLDVRDAAAFGDGVQKMQFDLYVSAYPNPIDDPDSLFSNIAISTGAGNNTKISSPETDALYAKQSQTLDVTPRKQLVQELELKLLNLFQAVGLGFPDAPHGVWKTLQNYRISSSIYVNQRYQDVWLS